MAKRSKEILYNTIGNTVSLFFQWLIIIIIPRIADFSDAGIFAIAISICAITNMVATFSMYNYQITDQYRAYTEGEYGGFRIFTVLLSVLLGAAIVLFSGYTATQSLVIAGYFIYSTVMRYTLLQVATMQIMGRLDYYGKCMILEGITSFSSFTIPYYLTGDLVLSVFCMAIFGGGVYGFAILRGYKLITGHRYPITFLSKEKLIQLTIISFPLLLSAVCPIAITAFPKIILQHFSTDELVGIFSTLTAPTIIIPTLISGVFSPTILDYVELSRNGDNKGLSRKYFRMIGMISAFVLLCLFAGILFGRFAFELLYGSEISDYVYLFNIMIIGIGFYTIGFCGNIVLVTKNQRRESAVASVIATVISAAVLLVTIPSEGIWGATIGLLISYTIFAILVSGVVLLKPIKD